MASRQYPTFISRASIASLTTLITMHSVGFKASKPKMLRQPWRLCGGWGIRVPERCILVTMLGDAFVLFPTHSHVACRLLVCCFIPSFRTQLSGLPQSQLKGEENDINRMNCSHALYSNHFLLSLFNLLLTRHSDSHDWSTSLQFSFNPCSCRFCNPKSRRQQNRCSRP